MNYVSFILQSERVYNKRETVTMPQQRKLDCPICNYSRPANLSDHLTKVHGINGQERKCLLAKARFLVLSMQPDQPQPFIPEVDSIPQQFGNSLPKTSYYLSKRNYQTQYHPTLHQMRMKTS